MLFPKHEMLAQHADLRLCALMSLSPYVLRPFVCAVMSGFDMLVGYYLGLLLE